MIPFPRLHAVTDDRVLRAPDFLARATALATGPEVAIHVRGHLAGRELLRLTEAVREAVRGRGARIFVNDRADVASLSGADGLHLPAAGLPTPAARRIAGAASWIGRSAHGRDELRTADAEELDYVMLGPIWPTTSHPGRPALGPAMLSVATVPVVAIGGVTPQNTAECLAAGAHAVAAVSALWDAADPAAAARRFLLSFPG